MITRAKMSAVRAFGVRRLFEGGAYQLLCARCGAYSRAALIRVNTVFIFLNDPFLDIKIMLRLKFKPL